MITLFYTFIYIFLFEFLEINLKFYVFLGWGIFVLIKGFLGYRFEPLNYLNLFKISLSNDNYYELVSVILFLFYFYLKKEILTNMTTIITFPSLVIFIFYSSVINDKREP